MKFIGILLDTGFLHGLKDEDDPRHAESQSILNWLKWADHKPVVTTNLVVSETYTLLNIRSKGQTALLAHLDALFWGPENFFRILYLVGDDFCKIAQILRKYTSPKKILSFVDASLIYIGECYKYREIVSFDAHFDGIFTRIHKSKES